MAQGDTFAQVLASGTQDLAALAGLFCTDSVEANLLSTHFGYGTSAISSLSILGILGLVRATIKISLGLEGCRAAGFNLDSLRGMFGYKASEAPPGGSAVACEAASVKLNHSGFFVSKTAIAFDDVKNPMLKVASCWGSKLANTTVVNLGNKQAENSILQSWWAAAACAFICSGTTAWLIACVPGSWNWTRFFATVVFHLCLFLNVGVPIWFQYRTSRPGKYLDTRLWNVLTGKSFEQCHFQVLQARVNNGNVLHFQGTTTTLQSLAGRIATLVLAVVTAVCYVCQYAILKEGTNTQSIVWVALQATSALLRVIWWISDPEFDNPDSHLAEFALINNTAFPRLTPFEMICCCDLGETFIAVWAWQYLLSSRPGEVLKEAIQRGADDLVPEDAEISFTSNLHVERLMQGRQCNTKDKSGEPPRLAFWRKKGSNETHPVLLVKVVVNKYSPSGTEPIVSEAWVEAVEARCLQCPELLNADSMFALTLEGKRFNLRPYDHKLDQSKSSVDTYVATVDTFNFLRHRSLQVGTFIRGLLHGDDFTYRRINTWGKPVVTSARGGSMDRRGRRVHHSGLSVLEVDKDLDKALHQIGAYIAEPYRDPKRKRLPKQSSIV